MQSAFGVEHGEITKAVKTMKPAKGIFRQIAQKAKKAGKTATGPNFPNSRSLARQRGRI